jgi:hypothetical protein
LGLAPFEILVLFYVLNHTRIYGVWRYPNMEFEVINDPTSS